MAQSCEDLECDGTNDVSRLVRAQSAKKTYAKRTWIALQTNTAMRGANPIYASVVLVGVMVIRSSSATPMVPRKLPSTIVLNLSPVFKASAFLVRMATRAVGARTTGTVPSTSDV